MDPATLNEAVKAYYVARWGTVPPVLEPGVVKGIEAALKAYEASKAATVNPLA